MGGIMILTGTVGLGIYFRNRFYDRIEVLKKLILIIDLFLSEIDFNKATMPQCCLFAGEKLLGDNVKESYIKKCTETDMILGKALINVHDSMKENDGLTFETAFKEEVGKCMAGLTLEKCDINDFMRVAETGSFRDGQLQLKALHKIKDDLTERVTELKENAQDRGKIAVGLGVMGGFLLVIILL
jgi:stage III sporulation protein AB